MPDNELKLQIDSSVDKFNYVLYGTAHASTCIATLAFIHSPIIAASAFAISGFLSQPLSKAVNQWLLDSFPNTPQEQVPDSSRTLPELITTLSQKLKVTPAPHLHILDQVNPEPLATKKQSHNKIAEAVKRKLLGIFANPTPDFIMKSAILEAAGVFVKQKFLQIATYLANTSSQKPEIFGDVEELRASIYGIIKKTIQIRIGRYAQASALTANPSIILVSQPLLQITKQNEKEAIVAHEMGHLAARHVQKSDILYFMQRATTLAARTNFASVLLSSLSGAAVLGSGILAYALTKKLSQRIGITSEDEREKSALQNISHFAANTTVVGAACLSGQKEVLIAWAATTAALTASKAIEARYKRCNEFQADRIAAQVTQDPQSMADSLNTLMAYYVSLKPEIIRHDYTKGPLIMRPYKMAKAMFWSYPSVERRCKRLEKLKHQMAKTQEASLI